MKVGALTRTLACLTLCCLLCTFGLAQKPPSTLSTRTEGSVHGGAASFQPSSSPPRAVAHEFPAGKEILHDRYIRVVSEASSPVERLYIPTKDGLYVAAAHCEDRSRKGNYPPWSTSMVRRGGKGIDVVVNWSLGTTGSPVWERFLQEGYAVVVADYRNGPVLEGAASRGDDGVAVVDYVRALR